MSTWLVVCSVMGGGPWLDERQQRAWRGLMTTYADVAQYLDRQLRRRDDLSRADYEVLVMLSEAGCGLRAVDLGRMLRWEKSRLSQHLTRMEGRDLVRREPCAGDQRGSLVVLTPRGRAAIEAAAPSHAADVRAVLVDHLSPAQLDLLGDLAEVVRDRVAELERVSR
jgi:DNA-binding MarR family transcriptional regulator